MGLMRMNKFGPRKYDLRKIAERSPESKFYKAPQDEPTELHPNLEQFEGVA